jgi:hypothetical protein
MKKTLVAQQHEAATPVQLLTAGILLNRKTRNRRNDCSSRL